MEEKKMVDVCSLSMPVFMVLKYPEKTFELFVFRYKMDLTSWETAKADCRSQKTQAKYLREEKFDCIKYGLLKLPYQEELIFKSF